MLRYHWLLPALISLLGGCATERNLWNEINEAARPSSAGLQQTQLAIIGNIAAPEETFDVAVQRLVLTGMLAPRGQEKLLLFDRARRLVASYGLLKAYPLWCEGSRIYLGGEGFAYDIPLDPSVTAPDPDSPLGGNVIDFSRGVHQPFMTREKKYGSSGGIEDDPWQVRREPSPQ